MTCVRSSLAASLMRKTLLRGLLWAGCGATLLLVCGTCLKPDTLAFLGLPSLVLSSLLIGYGLLPYRKLSRLEIHPHELLYDGSHLLFRKGGKGLLKIPCSCIREMKYRETGERYGIALSLIASSKEKVHILQRSFDIEAFLAHSRRHFGCDLFFPYFTERSLKTLREEL